MVTDLSHDLHPRVQLSRFLTHGLRRTRRGSLETYGDVSTFYLADLQGLTSARLVRSEDGVTLASVKPTYKKAP